MMSADATTARGDGAPADRQDEARPTYSLGQMTRYALSLGTFGFGGPVALVGYMHRDLVERRKWISEADYKEGLTLSQMMPGPLAAQLAIYLGYVHYGLAGATLVGTAFVLPSFVMVVALGWAYTLYGGLPWMQAVFYGVGGCVIGIIAISAFKLTRKTVSKSGLLWGIYLASALATVITETESIWLFLGAGAIVWLTRAPPRILGSGTTALGLMPFGMALPGVPQADYTTLGQILLFFTKAGAFVFGSGLAIVPFLHQGVVQQFGWLDEHQFIDAVAVAMITPGPVVITVVFIGFLAAGFLGAVAAAIGIFLPVYLFTIIPAPWFSRNRDNALLKAFVLGATSAATGAIAGAVILLGRRAIYDVPTAAVALVSLVVLWRFKVPEPILVAAAGIVGLVVFLLFKGGA